MSQPSPIDALVERIRSGSAPEQVRAAAARGALPFPPSALARLYVLLQSDPVESVREEAARSLDALDAEDVRSILHDEECSADVLTHFATKAARDESIAEPIAFREDTPAEALETLAAKGSAAVIDLVLTNEQRLLCSPAVLDRLSMNPALRNDQRARLLELLDRASKRRDDAARDRETAAPADESALDLEEHAKLLEIDVGELFAASEILGADELEADDRPEIRNAYRKILTLNTAQRALLAMKGGREERSILIRDTNKLVALSVLRNGRLTENEIERIAAMRNVTQDVLRSVGSNREWVKNYTVVATLVRNPRTPPGISTNFISRLQNHDLKLLAKDKNVSELIRRMAKKTLDQRSQRTQSRFRRK